MQEVRENGQLVKKFMRSKIIPIVIEEAITNGVDFAKYYGIIVVVNHDGCDGGSLPVPRPNNTKETIPTVLLDSKAWNMTFIAHEMLHGYGLGDSFGYNSDYTGAYGDPFDIMSAMECFYFTNNNALLGKTGPVLPFQQRRKLVRDPIDSLHKGDIAGESRKPGRKCRSAYSYNVFSSFFCR
jgi:hypothetical protein